MYEPVNLSEFRYAKREDDIRVYIRQNGILLKILDIIMNVTRPNYLYQP